MLLKKTDHISVLMSVYNTDFCFVKRAIDSVLNQDYPFFELIIVDDGSNSGLEKPLLNYVKKHEDNITYLRHKNCGQAQSINKAVKICEGKYIAFIDSDDEYKPNHLSTCIASIQENDLIATHTDTIVNRFEDYFVPDKYDCKNNIHVDDCILFATLFGKTEVFKSVSFKSMYAADSDFYEQASKKYQVRKLPNRTYIYYRNHSNSITASLKEKQSLLN